jgi:hypothetical protein
MTEQDKSYAEKVTELERRLGKIAQKVDGAIVWAYMSGYPVEIFEIAADCLGLLRQQAQPQGEPRQRCTTYCEPYPNCECGRATDSVVGHTPSACTCPSCGKPAITYANDQGTTLVECVCFTPTDRGSPAAKEEDCVYCAGPHRPESPHRPTTFAEYAAGTRCKTQEAAT